MAIGFNGVSTNSDRGSEPREWVHSEMVPSITFTWHHTIPWNKLRWVWDFLCQRKEWSCIEEYLLIISAPRVKGIILEIKKGMFHDDDQDGNARDLLSLLTWQGWNIVEGPGGGYRQDDPGELYDQWLNSGFDSGLSTTQCQTLQSVDLLNKAMDRLYEHRNGPDLMLKSSIKKLEIEFRTQRKKIRGKDPIKWNPGMWQVVTEGRLMAKTKTWYTSPVWIKKT